MRVRRPIDRWCVLGSVVAGDDDKIVGFSLIAGVFVGSCIHCWLVIGWDGCYARR